MLTLKPCPFCGGHAEADSNSSFREFVSGKISRQVTIYCAECSAEITVCVPDVPDITVEQIAEMWNKRSEIETLLARIAELEENTPSRFERMWNAAEDHNNALLNKVAELEKQRNGLAKDAERYRWLRDKAEWSTRHDPSVSAYVMDDSPPALYGEELDAAIDALLSSAQEGAA